MNNLLKPLAGILPLIVIMWGVYFINFIFLNMGLNRFGIEPREFDGLIGILASPFLHGNFFHILSNTIPLLILPVLLTLSEGRNKMWAIIVLGTLISGLFTWLVGSSGTVVVGASGVVFVLIGYLISDCIFNPCIRSIPIGVITFILFGGSVFSLQHFAPSISLAAHAGGFIAGVILARFYGAKDTQPETQSQ